MTITKYIFPFECLIKIFITKIQSMPYFELCSPESATVVWSVNPNAPNYWAAENGHIEIVKVLACFHGNPNDSSI